MVVKSKGQLKLLHCNSRGGQSRGRNAVNAWVFRRSNNNLSSMKWYFCIF